jgi:hypothetical protein
MLAGLKACANGANQSRKSVIYFVLAHSRGRCEGIRVNITKLWDKEQAELGEALGSDGMLRWDANSVIRIRRPLAQSTRPWQY